MKGDGSQRFSPGLLLRLKSLRKIIILRASRIGDFVCATPAFRLLRAALPDSEITLIALPMLQPLAERNTALDRFVAFPGWPGIAEQLYSRARSRSVISALRAERFDLAIQMHGSGVYANPFLRAIRARFSAGFIRACDSGRGLDAAMPLPDGNERDRLIALVNFLGVPAMDAQPQTEFPLWPQDRIAAEKLLRTRPRPLIGLHAGARDNTRRWPFSRFLATGQMLAKAMGGTIVLVGDRIDDPVDRSSVCDLRGLTSLPELGAVLANLSVLITNDSGPAHIAYALRVPSVTIFGATDPGQWGPPPGPHKVVLHSIGCRPCGRAECEIGNACLTAVSPEDVYAAALASLRENQRSEHGER